MHHESILFIDINNNVYSVEVNCHLIVISRERVEVVDQVQVVHRSGGSDGKDGRKR